MENMKNMETEAVVRGTETSCHKITVNTRSGKISIGLPSDGQQKEESRSWAVSLLRKSKELIDEGKLELRQGSYFKFTKDCPADFKFTGAIILSTISAAEGEEYRLFPVYKEELGFIERLDGFRFISMLRYLKEEELNILNPNRYNIILDEEDRRRCR